ncbi:SRPBCC domain-containing protein [Streptomyces sp. NPDC006872]|uniref:SRPBCC family protein n=1 Tax=Streptomyces sp. NPDC006872 TaxID=3155720 RepID=UPI00340FF6C8
MSVTSVDKDFDSLSLTVTAEFPAGAEQVWQLWADPRRLERWWGPPAYPATVEKHQLTPGGEVAYFMTGPEGDEHHGWWHVTSVAPPASLEFTDGFADDKGNPSPGMPTTTVRVRLTPHGDDTRMELRSGFGTREQMEQLMTMGMEEGLKQAVGQMDELLGE